MHGGTKWITWDIPFVTRCFYKHEVFCKVDCDGWCWKNWIDVTDRSMFMKRVGYLNYADKDNPTEAVVYNGVWKDFDGEEVPAIYRLERRTWRRKWLMWTSMFDKQRTEIEVSFKSGVGKGKGSWKGGVLGTSFEIKSKESPQECFERANRENRL